MNQRLLSFSWQERLAQLFEASRPLGKLSRPLARSFAQFGVCLTLSGVVGFYVPQAAHGQALPVGQANLMPATAQAQFISQSQTQNELPIDLTPVHLPERAGAAFESYKSEALFRLPARMFFNVNVENSLRLETNVFETLKRNRADGVYRILPDVTVGYSLTPKTRVSANYFYLRDNYMDYAHALSRSIHSFGFAVNHDIQMGEKNTLTAGFFARELWIDRAPDLSDLLPSLAVYRRAGPGTLLYGSATGQFRFRHFLGRYQEIDQFYSFGSIRRAGRWSLLADTTFVSNLGRTKMRGGHNQQIFVVTLEAARQIHRRLPLVAFVRAQPIFNIGANSSPGMAGFDFRLFGGIRAQISKPAIFPPKFLRG